MRRIGSGSRAMWCSRPARVRRTSPARSSTFTCFEMALSDMSKGWARSVTRAAPFASRWTISRRVGSESAAKARSSTGIVIYSTYGLNIPTGTPLSSDRWQDLFAAEIEHVSDSQAVRLPDYAVGLDAATLAMYDPPDARLNYTIIQEHLCDL